MGGRQLQFAGAPDSRWYFWDGGFLAIGRAEGIFSTNAHHVFTLMAPACPSPDGPTSIRTAERSWAAPGSSRTIGK